MQNFQEFLENSMNQKSKKLIPLTGEASAGINRIMLEDGKELIVRRSLSKEQLVRAIPIKLEAKI